LINSIPKLKEDKAASHWQKFIWKQGFYHLFVKLLLHICINSQEELFVKQVILKF